MGRPWPPASSLALLLLIALLCPQRRQAVVAQNIDEQNIPGTVRINCGGVTYVDVWNRTWAADSYYDSGENRTVVVPPSGSSTLTDSSLGNDGLFESFRTWPTGDNNSYVIPIGTSNIYWVRLYFAEMELVTTSKRQFAIYINEKLMRKNFFVPGSQYYVGFLEYSFPTNASSLNITFGRETGNPYISAFEVVPAPAGQLRETFTPAQGPIVLSLTDRGNLGAPSYSYDSEGRAWNNVLPASLRSPNVEYISTNSSVAANTSSGFYSEWLYQTMFAVSEGNLTSAGLGVQLQVDIIGSYLMILHFAEIQYSNVGDRIMDIYMNNQLAYEGLDVIAKVGKNTAMNVTLNTTSTEVSTGISLAVQPNGNSLHKEPMLSAIELLYINYLEPQVVPVPSSSSFPVPAIIAIVAGGIIALIAIMALIYLCWWRRVLARRYALEQRPGGAELLKALQSRAVRFVPLRELERATAQWADARKLGEGGFGAVFRADVAGQEWAVKRAKRAQQATLDDFTNEVDLISQLNHINLVRLLGFCTEKGEQIFVYEFCSNGTLHSYIKPNSSKELLSFEKRLEIMLESARGLNYLHSFAKEPVIHRDIKSENILLDKNLQAKVADFGLLKRIEVGLQKQRTVKIAGTRGYMDPEYYATFQVTDKSDVYSFGVLMLETFTGLPPVIEDKANPDNSKTLVAWARPLALRGRWDDLVDPRFHKVYPRDQFRRVVELALSAVKQHGHERPSMEGIVRGLEKISAQVCPYEGPIPEEGERDIEGGDRRTLLDGNTELSSNGDSVIMGGSNVMSEVLPR